MITVIKLGGSLLHKAVLPACLEAVERYSGQVVIVPGGGVFADQVRKAQSEWHFDEATAHRMAILAMQQMALLFHSLKPVFPLLHSVSRPLSGRACIWSPEPDELDAAGIPAGWDITSDSLAAWLACQVGADALILIKSCQVPETMSLTELQQQGIIDAGFVQFAAHAAFQITITNKDRFLASHDQVH